MNGSGRLPLRILADWLEGRLSAAKAETVAGAVAAGDSRTLVGVEWLRRFRDDSRALPLEQPPALVRARLHREFELRYGEARPRVSRTPILARKTFDSRRDRSPAGVRGGGAVSGTIHLAYRAGSVDLVLDAYPIDDGRLRLDGQLLRSGSAKDVVVEASIRGPGIRLRTVDGDTLGRFSLAAVPVTATELEVDDGEIALMVTLDLAGSGAE